MEPIRSAAPSDDEFRTPVESWPTRYPAPGTYLRVLANPFLGVAALLLATAGLVRAIDGKAIFFVPAWAFLALFILVLKALPALFQFHCLDCGATGPLRDWKAHTCFPSSLNRFLGRRGWFSWLTPGIQVVLWLVAMLHVFLSVAILL